MPNPPVRARVKLIDKRVHNDKFIQFWFEYSEPAVVPFEAGQYASVQVTDRGDRRSYSICSSPEVDHGFELLADVSPQGLGSTYLQNLQIGQESNILVPMGNFLVAEAALEPELVFLATGSGIAPLKAMILDQLQVKRDERQMTLYWGMRSEDQMFWQDEFQELSQNFPNFKFHPVISQATDAWPLCRGRVTNCLAVHDINASSGFYICGNAAMMADVINILTAKGVPAERMHHEKFH